jgi:DDE superfamily endonuclease
VIPPDHDGEYVARMEDVLEVYRRPHDATAPVVCMDEMPVQLTKETRQPIPAGPGRPRRIDYEYERNGTANIFMFVEPLAGFRQTQVTERRTRVDWAMALRDLVNGRYADAKVIVLIMDNLNTHTLGSLYEAFPPAEARRLAERLEIHYTPKHGSWLNIAENELSALSRQCLSRRIGTIDQLTSEVAAWEVPRNEDHVPVQWRLTIDQARIKLHKVYPKIQN